MKKIFPSQIRWHIKDRIATLSDWYIHWVKPALIQHFAHLRIISLSVIDLQQITKIAFEQFFLYRTNDQIRKARVFLVFVYYLLLYSSKYRRFIRLFLICAIFNCINRKRFRLLALIELIHWSVLLLWNYLFHPKQLFLQLSNWILSACWTIRVTKGFFLVRSL